MADAIVSVEAVIPQTGGALRLFPVGGWKYSSSSGRFRLVVARTSRYHAVYWRKGRDGHQTVEWEDATTSSTIERDFIIK